MEENTDQLKGLLKQTEKAEVEHEVSAVIRYTFQSSRLSFTFLMTTDGNREAAARRH